MMMEMKNRSHGHSIDSPKSRHVINISIMSRYEDTYIYKATPKQHLKLNSCEGYSEAVLKRSVSYKNTCISLVPLTIPSVGLKAYLIYFFGCVVDLKGFFCESSKFRFHDSHFVKESFFCADFEHYEISI